MDSRRVLGLAAGHATTEHAAPGAVIVRSLSGDQSESRKKGSGISVMKLSLKTIVPSGMLGLALVAGSATSARADFAYPNFNSIAGLTLNGAAIQSAPTLSVTPPVRASAGSFWRNDRQTISNGFESTFTFRVRDVAGLGADGFAFLIHNAAAGTAALGGGGGAMGYATNEVFSSLPGNTGIENSLAIEFDMWDNTGGWDDFNSSKSISVQTNGTQANRPSAAFSRGQVSPLADFGDGAVHTVRLSYAPGILDIYLDNLVTPVLTVNVNLATTLALHNGSDAFVGFTAGTGALANAQRHEILSWEFGSTVVPTPATVSLIATGGLLLGRRRRR